MKISSVQTSCLSEKYSFTCTNDKVTSELLENNIFTVFLEHLEESNPINDFTNTITSIACNKLPTTNLAWKSALYRGNWAMCSSMHSMQWDRLHSILLSIGNLFGSSFINVLVDQAISAKSSMRLYQRTNMIPFLANVTLQFLQQKPYKSLM